MNKVKWCCCTIFYYYFALQELGKLCCEFFYVCMHYALCTHTHIVRLPLHVHYCHFDAIKIERTTKIHVIGMKKHGRE